MSRVPAAPAPARRTRRQRGASEDRLLLVGPDRERPGGSLLRVAALGVAAGMRSQAPLALLALAVRGGRIDAGGGILRLLGARAVVPLAVAALAGELVGDKLPVTPSRLDPGPLGGRVVIGAAAGAALARSAGRGRTAGALAGGLGAAAGAYAGYHLRVRAARATGLADPVLGAVEDALALAVARYALAGGPASAADS
jgi:uncharacterized membrane protein